MLGFNFTTLTVATIFSGFGGGLAGEAIYKVWSQELSPTLVRGSAQGSTTSTYPTITAAFAFVTPAIADASPRLLMGLLVGLNLADKHYRALLGPQAAEGNRCRGLPRPVPAR